jgi:hypothetical protein
MTSVMSKLPRPLKARRPARLQAELLVAFWVCSLASARLPSQGSVRSSPRVQSWRRSVGAALGATTGGLVGGLIGLGIPEIEAKRYEQKLRNGNFLIAVDARDSNQVDRAKEIFKDAGAEDIATSSLSKAPRGAASTRVSEIRVT